MVGRSFAVVVGFLGGLAVLLGGFLSFLSVLARVPLSSVTWVSFSVALTFLGTVVVGFLILLTSRPRFWWWPGRRLFNGIWLIALGVLAWILAGGFIVSLAGAVLTVIAGVMLPLEGAVFSAFNWRRRWFRRRWF